MGKRGGAKRPPNLSSATPSHKQLSLREQNTGKKQAKTINVKSKLKLEHLQNLATWAGGEASVPSLAAFFGHQLAAANESLGLQPDPSLFSCLRCEAILQPGFNCTVRIEKTQVKARSKCKKSRISTQNNVVYKCHFCSHWNLKRGTPIGHMKEMNPAKAKPSLKQEHMMSTLLKYVSMEEDPRSKEATDKVDGIDVQAIADEVSKVEDNIALPATAGDSCNSNSPVTPSVKAKVTLDVKKRKRNKSGTKMPVESEINSATTSAEKTVCVSSKRRKSWTSLKEIAGRSDHDITPIQNIANLSTPFPV